jgi:tape measure domain-containing protein
MADDGQRVESLYVDLSLRLVNFQQTIQNAVSQVSAIGASMQQAFGTTPTKAVRDTDKEFKRMTDNARAYVKDVSRVITGILISQTFYQLIGSIREAAQEVFRFSQSMEEALVSFELLLGSATRAQQFISVLEDFAATTPFQMDDAKIAAQRLMAMGFAAENVVPILRDLTDAAAILGGGPETIDRITRALGQMKTRGRIATQELIQLSEAGIPVFQILQEELGLTNEQLGEIGKYKISGDIGVAAILKGIEKRYGEASQRISRTTRGLISTIKDDLLIISRYSFADNFERLRQRLEGFVERLNALRQSVKSGGLKAVAANLIPPELRGTLTSIAGSLGVLWDSFRRLLRAIGPVAKATGELLLRALSVLLPIVAAIANVVTRVAEAASKADPLIRILIGSIGGLAIAGGVSILVTKLVLAIQRLRAAIAASWAVIALKKAFEALAIVMMRNPWVAILSIIAAALLGLALSSKTASDWLDSVIKKLAMLAGFNIDTMLQPADPTGVSNALAEYNKALAEMQQDLSKVGKEAEKAGDKAKDKFLASFDEVHVIPDSLEDATSALDELTTGLGLTPAPSLPTTPPTGGGESDAEDLLPKLPREIEMPKIIWPIPPTDPPPGAVAEVIEDALARIRVSVQATTVAAAAVVKRWAEEVGQSIDSLAQRTTTAMQNWSTSIQTSVSNWVTNTRTSISMWVQNTAVSISSWAQTAGQVIAGWAINAGQSISGWARNTQTAISGWYASTVASISSWYQQTISTISQWAENAKIGISNTLQSIATFWENHKITVIGIVGAIVVGILVAIGSISSSVAAALAGLAIIILSPLIDAKNAVAAEVEDTKVQVQTKWQQLIQWLQDKWESLKASASTKWNEVKISISTSVQSQVDSIREKWSTVSTYLGNLWLGISTTASNYWTQIKNTIKNAINGIISMINSFIRSFNRIEIRVPSVNIPLVGTVGGYSISVPKIPEIPQLRTGGIVTKDQLVRVGEGNNPEAVIPLSGPAAQPFAQAIAREIASVLAATSPKSSSQPVIVQAGVIVADQLGLKELERRLRKIRTEENLRIAGSIVRSDA